MNDLDLKPVWVCQTNSLTTTWLIDFFNGRRAIGLGYDRKVVFAMGFKRQTNKAWVAQLGDVDVMIGIGASDFVLLTLAAYVLLYLLPRRVYAYFATRYLRQRILHRD